jgi:hypothetical protein
MCVYCTVLYCTVLYCTVLYCTVHTVYCTDHSQQQLPPVRPQAEPAADFACAMVTGPACHSITWPTVLMGHNTVLTVCAP